MKKNKLNYSEIIYLITVIGFSLLCIGISLNFKAVQTNEGRMPVVSNLDLKTDTHYYFKDVSKINNLHLVDIYPIKDYTISIGDILIIAGMITVSIGLVLFIFEHSCRMSVRQ